MKFAISLLLMMSCLLGCDQNIFKSAGAESDLSNLESARTQLDSENYEQALVELQKVSTDSEELRLLRSAARLGASGLSMWTLLKDIIDSSNFSSSGSSSGSDKFFDKISSAVVGEGEEKKLRLEAINSSIQDLLGSPDSSSNRAKNLACFLAAIMALPTVSDAGTAMQGVATSLASIAASIDVSNPQAQCPDVSGLNSSLSAIAEVQTQLASVLAATKSCKFINTSDTSSDFNALETKLAKFNTAADAGCSTTPSCGSSAACQALGVGCIYSAIAQGDASSLAKDGLVSRCELVQNCINTGSCF